MQKTYTIENLDCANCAAELENAISKINGVSSVSVSFISQKLAIEFNAEEAPLLKEIRRIAAKIEPDCEIY